jgi:hypothetical protein
MELSKMLDKSDNESSVLSVGAKAPLQMSNIHSKLNEPIEEVEDEKEEGHDVKKKIISESIQKRRKANKHIELGSLNRNKSILIQSDPIDEEIEVDDDELYSENNFYVSWEKHKKYLLTQDEQQKLLN